MSSQKDPVDQLFDNAMKGRWDEVIDAYEKQAELQNKKITRAGDTALHIAVSDNQGDAVSKLANIIGARGKDNAVKILSIKNEAGNTALHLAASIGNVDMCHSMVVNYPQLINIHNNENETPLFSSVLHGKTKAYLCLNSHYKDEYKVTDYTLCRRGNGDTILHCAISSDYFGLAYKIIQDYPDLVNYMNESGLSPLHVLANENNAFRSGSVPGLIDRFVYRCIFVDQLPDEREDDMNFHKNSISQTSNYPENYADCMLLFKLMKAFYEVVKEYTLVVTNLGHHILRKLWGIFRFSRKENPQEIGRSPESRSPRIRKNSVGPKDEENPTGICSVPKSCPGKETAKEVKKIEVYPPNYDIIVLYLKLIINVLLIILGLGFLRIQKIKEKKQQHVWTNLLMNELVERASFYKYDNNGRRPVQEDDDHTKKDDNPTEVPDRMPSMDTDKKAADSSSSLTDEAKNATSANQKETDKIGKPMLVAAKVGVTELVDKFMDTHPAAIQELNTSEKSLLLLTYEKKEILELKKKETPILIAAKLGVVEMVEKILNTFPVAIQDEDAEKKNVVLLAVEHRQTEIYNFLLRNTLFKETVFRHLDNQGNSALHLAAKFTDCRPKLIAGAALQMQWEMKWYKFVRQSMPRLFFPKHNNEGQTPREIFTNTHKDIIAKGGEWLTKTSESCSVVAALIATVAFATSATVPGGVNENTGEPTFENEPAFDIFAIASLVALTFSVTALVFFLSILTSRYQENDFVIDLPRKLLLGLTSLFISIASMLLSFCAGHFFVLKDKMKYAVFPIYAATCLPVTFFAFAQLPLYFDLTRAIFNKEPQRGYKH